MDTQKFHFGHHLFSFHGRISRSMWWLTQIGLWLFSILTTWLYAKFGFHDAIWGALLTVFLLVVRLTANIKRLHDRGKSGWWILVFEIPVIGWIWGFVELGMLKGSEDHNEHGAPPRGEIP